MSVCSWSCFVSCWYIDALAAGFDSTIGVQVRKVLAAQGQLPPHQGSSLESLQHLTGLSRRTVANALQACRITELSLEAATTSSTAAGQAQVTTPLVDQLSSCDMLEHQHDLHDPLAGTLVAEMLMEGALQQLPHAEATVLHHVYGLQDGLPKSRPQVSSTCDDVPGYMAYTFLLLLHQQKHANLCRSRLHQRCNLWYLVTQMLSTCTAFLCTSTNASMQIDTWSCQSSCVLPHCCLWGPTMQRCGFLSRTLVMSGLSIALEHGLRHCTCAGRCPRRHSIRKAQLKTPLHGLSTWAWRVILYGNLQRAAKQHLVALHVYQALRLVPTLQLTTWHGNLRSHLCSGCRLQG